MTKRPVTDLTGKTQAVLPSSTVKQFLEANKLPHKEGHHAALPLTCPLCERETCQGCGHMYGIARGRQILLYKINPNPNPNPNTNPSSPYCIMRFIFGSRVHVPSRPLRLSSSARRPGDWCALRARSTVSWASLVDRVELSGNVVAMYECVLCETVKW